MSAKAKVSGSVVAGFPSPAEQYQEPPLDLNELLVKRPAATYFVRVEGDSMVGAGISEISPERSEHCEAMSLEGCDFLGRTVVFPVPTDATNEMLRAIREEVDALYVEGTRYRKTGIVFFGLESPARRTRPTSSTLPRQQRSRACTPPWTPSTPATARARYSPPPRVSAQGRGT